VNDDELLRIGADTSFTYDTRGRMLLSNEPRVQERRPAPRLVLGWTTTAYVLRLSATVPDDLAQRLSEIIERQPPAGDLRTTPAASVALRAALEAHAPITGERRGPAYRFPASIGPLGDAIRITASNRQIARDTFPWLYDEYAGWRPCFAVVRDGAAVSVCFSSRIGTRACAAGVETLPEFRGHGYAAAVTAAWGTAVRQAGLLPLYSTAWDNLASQAVAGKLGLTMFAANVSWA